MRIAGSRFVPLLTVVCLCAAAVYGDNNACLSRTAIVGVSGKNGEPSEGMTAADFKVSIGGKSISVQSATPPSQSPRVVILLDASANHDQSTWAATQAMVDEFLAGFPAVGDFTLVTFDDKVQQVIHQADRATLQGTMGETFPSGRRESETGLVEALQKADATFASHRQGDAELLITTADQIGKDAEQSLKRQVIAGVRISGASFDQTRRPGPKPFSALMTVENYSPIEGSVKDSGGLWTWFDANGLDVAEGARRGNAAGKLTSALVRNYVALEFRLTSPLTKPEKMKVELIKSAKSKDQYTTYPQQLFPCD